MIELSAFLGVLLIILVVIAVAVLLFEFLKQLGIL